MYREEHQARLSTQEKLDDRPSRRQATWFNREEVLDRPSVLWQAEKWLEFLHVLKEGGLSLEGSWWMVKALFLQRGKTKLGFEEQE